MSGVNKVVPWLSWYKPNLAAKLRLFCFPYAGSGALIYRTWSKSLPAHVEVCPFNFRGAAAVSTNLFRVGPGHKFRSQSHTYNLPDAAFMDDLQRLKGTPAEVLEHRN
jgi:surfactin synthase thioesterase subunit